jgi:hypothetical protein
MRNNILKKGLVFGILLLFVEVSIVSTLTANPSFFMNPINQPPNIPSNPSPSNQATNVYETTELFWNGGDPDGDPVTYTVYFGITSSPLKVKNNQSALSYTPGALKFNTKYYWKIVAWDNHNLSTEGPIWCFTTRQDANFPPYQPSKPVGIINVMINLEYIYISGAYDPDDDAVYYLWDWGDGNDSGWLGPYNSGTLCDGRHIWNTKENCTVKVKAKDIYGAESEWSDPLPITVPYSYYYSLSQVLELFFQRFFYAFVIPQHVR